MHFTIFLLLPQNSFSQLNEMNYGKEVNFQITLRHACTIFGGRGSASSRISRPSNKEKHK